MKVPTILLFIALTTSIATNGTSATIYNVTGTISRIFYDSAGIIEDEGIMLGDNVYARFCVDFESEGYFLHHDGSITIPEDPQMTNSPSSYFHATFLDGTLLPVKNGGFYNNPDDIAEYHLGYNNSNPTGNSGVLKGGSGNSYFTLKKESYTDATVQNWVTGENLTGVIASYADVGHSVLWADVSVIGIQNIPTQYSCESLVNNPDRNIYTLEDISQAVISERARWDANNDNKIGMEEAIHSLKILSGN